MMSWFLKFPRETTIHDILVATSALGDGGYWYLGAVDSELCYIGPGDLLYFGVRIVYFYDDAGYAPLGDGDY